jgi:type III secretion apparatus needle protein
MNPDEINAMMSSLDNQRGADDDLKRALRNVQQDPNNPSHLLDLQAAMQKWSLATQTQTTVLQQLDDSLKNIITKMS